MTQETQPQTPQGFERRYAIQSVIKHIRSGVPEIICYGARGTGKTLSLCELFLEFMLTYPGMVQVWIRRHRARMVNSTLKTFETEVLPDYPGIFPMGATRDGRRGYQANNGSEIIVLGMDDSDRYKSMQADLFWANECSELTEGEWEEIGGAARATRFNNCPFKLKIGDHNPMPPSHWTHMRCKPFPTHLYPRVMDDGTRMGEWLTRDKHMQTQRYNAEKFYPEFLSKKVVFTHADNPGYWDFDNWTWKQHGLDYTQKFLGRMTGTRKARYLEGREVADENTVYGGDFDREIHVCERFNWPRGWPVWVAYDPGFSHPAAAVFLGVAPNGQMFIIDEVHGRQITLKSMAQQIRDKASRYWTHRWLTDPRGANQKRQETEGRSVKDMMAQDHQLYFQFWKAAEGAGKAAQVEAVRSLLLQENPLQVMEHCVGTIGEFESWRNAVNVKGELLRGDDRYEDANNDAMDSLMGIIADNPCFQHSKFKFG